ncbi:hypothetical protein HHK36_017317 [Tetracentron sinense]|uniref:carotenoid 9,10-dioxygenase n=1 Tax=Tetracentron sinense TaxID=13715 RepID=A0A834Z157_TETSI|nr:hypothetical protein HHK36_017317 [Tetracentron sinense]
MAEKTTEEKQISFNGRGIVVVDPKPSIGIASKFVDLVEKLILKLTYDSSKPNHYLSGNFAPVAEETPPCKNLPVKGYLPKFPLQECLNGEFLRVGPNPKFAPVAGYHWYCGTYIPYLCFELFDGDGMIHGMHIKDGKATYVSRYVRTSRLKQEEYFGGSKFMKSCWLVISMLDMSSAATFSAPSVGSYMSTHGDNSVLQFTAVNLDVTNYLDCCCAIAEMIIMGKHNCWFITAEVIIMEKCSFKFGDPMIIMLCHLQIGDLKGLFGLLTINMQMLRAKLKVLDVSYGTGPSNTALIYHHGKLLALSEADKPYVLKVLENGDLQTLGMLDYDKRLAHSFTAHPKVDPFTGEMFTFGYSHSPPYITYRVISKDGFMHDPVPITISDPIMMHDFAITENYAIFMDLPLYFRSKVLPFLFAFFLNFS